MFDNSIPRSHKSGLSCTEHKDVLTSDLHIDPQNSDVARLNKALSIYNTTVSVFVWSFMKERQ